MVARIDRILDVVARAAEPMTLTEIAAAIGAPISSTRDLLRQLRAHGYLTTLDRRYRLGLRPHLLGLLGGVLTPAALEHAELERLSRYARAPIALAALVGREVLYLDHAGPRAPGRVQRVTDEHIPRPALRTAAGRLLVAFAPEADRERLLGEVDPEAAAAFAAELPAIRRQRLARSDGLADPGIRAIALPVTERGAVVAATVVTASRHRPARPDPALDQAAARLAEALAGRAG